MTDQPETARADSVHIPPEGRWGIDVRFYADGRREKHWVAPGTDPEEPGVRYQTHPAACDAPTWLVADVRSALWDHWPRCGACQKAADNHNTKEESVRQKPTK